MSPAVFMRPYLVDGSSIWHRACSVGHIRSQQWKRGVVLNKMAVCVVCDKSGKNCLNKQIKVKSFNCPSASHSTVFLTSALDAGELSDSRFGSFTSEESALGGWVGSTAVIDTM